MESLVPDVLGNIASFLPLRQISAFIETCKTLQEALQHNETWKTIVERKCGPHRLVPCASYRDLLRYQILSKGFSMCDFYIVHMAADGEKSGYWQKKPCADSKFGAVAHLNTVCWLELSHTLYLLPSSRDAECFDVIFRIKLSKPDFSCEWKVVVGAEEQIHWNQKKNDQHIIELAKISEGQRYAYLNIGSIKIPPTNPTDAARDTASSLVPVKFHMIGGNPHWMASQDWDTLLLVPVREQDMNGNQFTSVLSLIEPEDHPKHDLNCDDDDGATDVASRDSFYYNRQR